MNLQYPSFSSPFNKQYDEKALAARLLSLYAKRKPFSRYMTKF
ncbi:hypothetical protein CN984_12740 [Bacillus cereus]|uniref:Uncharacterized protein n=1 Tax=Bacillus cereus TaxID=1396 RepID=A0A2B9Q217_BACCE|nr:hypothetical protein COJ07_30355 [Bacillus cereus]PGO29006.1 hypothetical protein CN984_12740 [Bacillus cereus]